METTTKNISATQISKQKERIISGNPSIELVAPCKINEGILQISKMKQLELTELFNQTEKSICFFIPASGSGSRMFQFLYDFLNTPNESNRSEVERFLHAISEFAFFKKLPKEIQRKIQTQNIDLEEFISFLLEEDGMGYGSLPKGLIPFHHVEPFVLTPFQEHVLQAMSINVDDAVFHFTIQPKFKDLIKEGMDHVSGLTGYQLTISFSEQDASTNAVCLKADGELLTNEKGEIITRPAGHGALLNNLQAIPSDLIFVKNIDNIQHYKYTSEIEGVWKMLGGLLLQCKNDLKHIFDSGSIEDLSKFNEKFQIYSKSELDNLKTKEELQAFVSRPIRVCGMVRNEGQPGGGPFWVNNEGVISKQIVEKSQISMLGEQYRLMVQSTHFNPVIMALNIKDFEGNVFDLSQFKDDSKYFVVEKNNKGEKVKFVELPGLWNGSMAHWNTIFVEIPSNCFSPVKNVLDLLNYAHRAY